jgi:hypothetical protein
MPKLLIAKAAAEKALAVEFGRSESHVRDAWRFAAAIIVSLGFQLRDVKSLVESPSPWVKIVCCLSLVALGAALTMIIFCLQSNGYGHYPRGQKLWESLKPGNVSETEAEEAMLLMILQTREQNAKVNDANNRILRWAGWLFLAGVLLVVATQLLEAFFDWT